MARETLEQKAMRIAQETGLDYENVLQGMQMGDIDFQMAVAPYMGYKGEIDPAKHEFIVCFKILQLYLQKVFL